MADATVARTIYRALSHAAKRLHHQAHRHGSQLFTEVPTIKRQMITSNPKGVTRRVLTHPGASPAGVALRTQEESTLLGQIAPRLPAVLGQLRKTATGADGQPSSKAPSELINLTQKLFRSPVKARTPRSSSQQKDPLSQGFAVLALVNNRLRILEKMAYEPYSDVVTNGVRVKVASAFDSSHSHPGEFRFLYEVTITNESSPEDVQLVSRYWNITDLSGKTQEVAGPGVIGQQPILKQGESFTYSSSAAISNLKGSMQGSFVMSLRQTGNVFDAQVAPFALCPPTAKAPIYE